VEDAAVVVGGVDVVVLPAAAAVVVVVVVKALLTSGLDALKRRSVLLCCAEKLGVAVSAVCGVLVSVRVRVLIGITCGERGLNGARSGTGAFCIGSLSCMCVDMSVGRDVVLSLQGRTHNNTTRC
jgi:hypothetical protein